MMMKVIYNLILSSIISLALVGGGLAQDKRKDPPPKEPSGKIPEKDKGGRRDDGRGGEKRKPFY